MYCQDHKSNPNQPLKSLFRSYTKWQTLIKANKCQFQEIQVERNYKVLAGLKSIKLWSYLIKFKNTKKIFRKKELRAYPNIDNNSVSIGGRNAWFDVTLPSLIAREECFIAKNVLSISNQHHKQQQYYHFSNMLLAAKCPKI